jgi:hypothetical protein
MSLAHRLDGSEDRRRVHSSRELWEGIEDVARLGVRLISQTAVEAEVDVFLGRARYRGAPPGATASRVPVGGATLRTGSCIVFAHQCF